MYFLKVLSTATLLSIALHGVRASASTAELAILQSIVGEPTEAVVYLERAQGPHSVALEKKIELMRVQLPWHGSVDIEAGGYWRFEAISSGYRCVAAKDPSGPASESTAKCRMEEAGIITGTLELDPAPKTSPDFLRLMILESKYEKENESEYVFCPIRDGDFECYLPTGKLDIRLDVQGYGAEHIWKYEVRAGARRTVGKMTLKRGASLAGWIAGSVEAKDLPAEIELRPRLLMTNPEPKTPQTSGLHAMRSSVGPKGDFSFAGVRRGEYVLRGSISGLCDVTRMVNVPEKTSFIALDPLIFEPCPSLEVLIQPAIDFWGKNWSLSISRLSTVGSHEETVESSVGMDGSATIKLKQPGTHRMSVRDSTGNSWWTEHFDAFYGMPTVFVEIEAVRVRGTVLQGSDPAEGLLIFGTRDREPSIAMGIDNKGNFEGQLPTEGEWRVELERSGRRQFLEAVLVETRPGKSYAEVEIRIPDTLVQGVVWSQGMPAPRATVVVLRSEDTLEKELFGKSDEDGDFTFQGVRTGRIQLRAFKDRLVSEWYFADLKEGKDLKGLRLELVEVLTLEGRVSAEGRGVPGARLIGFPKTAEGRVLPVAGASRDDGSFEIRVSDGVDRLDLAVVTPGYETLLALVFPRSSVGQPIEIPLSGSSGNITLSSRDGEFPGSVAYGGGIVSMRSFILLMAQEGRMRRSDTTALSLYGLAPGLWRFCRTSVADTCATKELFPGEDAVVALPTND